MKRSWVEQVMGMPASLLLRGEDLGGADELVAAAYAELRHIDSVLSTYRVDSDISRIRRRELTAVDAEPMVAEVLSLCDLARTRTEGWFDADLPDGLDPSGLVKGWAIERVVDALSRLPEVDVCVNIGGDVAVRTSGAAFVAGIEDPRDRTALLTTVPLTGGGLATSGTAARGAHIVNPRTGRAAHGTASVSVVGPSLMWADVYATAAFAAGGQLTSLPWLSPYDALVLHDDGTVETTTSWPAPFPSALSE